MSDDPKCPRCGTALKIETVRVPTGWRVKHGPTFHQTTQYVEYETREEVSDCPRCTGSY